MIVDDLGDFSILVGFAVDDMTPVAPDRADIQEDGLVFGFGASECSVAPVVPIDGLARSRTQVGAGGVFQAICRLVGQSGSQFGAAKNWQSRSFAPLRMTPKKSAGLKPGLYKEKQKTILLDGG